MENCLYSLWVRFCFCVIRKLIGEEISDPQKALFKKHDLAVKGREPGAEEQQEAQPQGLQGQEGGGGEGQAQHRE